MVILTDRDGIQEIIDFVSRHPESNVSRRICRETLGEAPWRITGEVLRKLRHELEAADEIVVEGYHYLVR